MLCHERICLTWMSQALHAPKKFCCSSLSNRKCLLDLSDFSKQDSVVTMTFAIWSKTTISWLSSETCTGKRRILIKKKITLLGFHPWEVGWQIRARYSERIWYLSSLKMKDVSFQSIISWLYWKFVKVSSSWEY